MYAAPSIILFTVLSGAGFGFLVFLGLDPEPQRGFGAFFTFAVAFGLSLSGLAASAFHLGNPQRAWRAFSQWRSSWLSREAWASALALAVMGIYAFALIFLGIRLPLAGAVGAALSLLTLIATSMIYASLKTVPRWNTALTPVSFLLTGLSQGAILAGNRPTAWMLLAALAMAQILCWLRGDKRFAARGHDLGQATSLGALGRLRSFEPPHTGSNYLLKEFAFQVGRRHRAKLRLIGLVSMCVLPAICMIVPSFLGQIPAAAFALTGALGSRWLFFAEAEHVVTLYYGMNDLGEQAAR